MAAGARSEGLTTGLSRSLSLGTAAADEGTLLNTACVIPSCVCVRICVGVYVHVFHPDELASLMTLIRPEAKLEVSAQ